jgi:hypothetical protein
MPDVENAIQLTSLEVDESVPVSPGVYAAWLVDSKALAGCGVEGPAPRLMYVGRAVSAGGLRTRLRNHAEASFTELGDLLAVRGKTLFDWCGRNPHSLAPGYRPRPSPLGQLARTQALEWQLRHFHWAWRKCSREQATALESGAIKEMKPLLNLRGAGRETPQLRFGRGYGRARGRWLWHMAWAALIAGGDVGVPITEADFYEWQLDVTNPRCRVDTLGFPLPRSRWTIATPNCSRTVRIPSTAALWKLMRDAARDADPVVRNAIGYPEDDGEFLMWWAAHAGAELLPKPCSVRDALAASLGLASDAEAPGPGALPKSQAQIGELLRLVKLGLIRMRH